MRFAMALLVLLSTTEARKLRGPPAKLCLVQVQNERDLKNGTNVGSLGARLSITLAREMAKVQNYEYSLYDCEGRCLKPLALADACEKRDCDYVLYVDSDVFFHSPHRADPLRELAALFPGFVLATGLDYYDTNKATKWHDGSSRFYRTNTNAGMLALNCHKRITRHILAEWSGLCKYYSPTNSDQEALTQIETQPQYASAFVRDSLFLGQYSQIARHFPGDPNKGVPIPSLDDDDDAWNTARVSSIFRFAQAWALNNNRTSNSSSASSSRRFSEPDDWAFVDDEPSIVRSCPKDLDLLGLASSSTARDGHPSNVDLDAWNDKEDVSIIG